MKKYYLSFLLFSLNLLSQNQINEVQAKAAYVLAEEAYNNKNFISAITYLDECKKALGTESPKILYLKILSELEIAKTDAKYFDILENTIRTFEMSPGIKQFNEDKVFEIMKLKLKIKEFRKEALVEEEIKNKEKQFFFKTYDSIHKIMFKDLPIQVPFSNQSNLKESPFEKMKNETPSQRFEGLVLKYPNHFISDFPREGYIGSYLKGDVIKGYQILYWFESMYPPKSKAKIEFLKIISHLQKQIKKAPDIKEFEYQTINSWRIDNKTIEVWLNWKEEGRSPLSIIKITILED